MWVDISLFHYSMFPLLKREGLSVAYAAVMVVFWLGSWAAVRADMAAMARPRLARAAVALSIGGMLVLHACDALIAPPTHLPDLWTLLITSYSCAHFALFYLASALPCDYPQHTKQKHA